MALRHVVLLSFLCLPGSVEGRPSAEECAEDMATLQVSADAGHAARQEMDVELESHLRWVSSGLIKNADTVTREKKWHGVNYGNRFMPEDWIKVPYHFFDGVEKYQHSSRVALWDVQGDDAKSRMLKWLDSTILDEHFEEMASQGVEVLRIPTGYWNFVSYEGNDGPEVPKGWEEAGERMKNLHRIASPEEYKPYLDKCFSYAKKHGIKILLDLHGLPGTQNGEIHSGVCLEENGKNKELFQSEANKQMAIRAVEAMAKYVADPDRVDTLWGLQVINEPHLHNGHEFLKSFYEQAIQAARKHLDASKRVVLFVWTFDMHLWPDGAFPSDKYGEVVWDTHLYHFPPDGQKWTGQDGLAGAKDSYTQDLSQLRSFTRSKGNPLIIGEYSMAGPSFDAETANEFVRWLVDEFDFAAMGSIFWTFDCQYTEWSFQKLVSNNGFDWSEIWRADRDPCIEGPRVTLKSQSGNTYLTAVDNGEVRASATKAQFWESWAPCYYKVHGQSKVAFRSEAHSKWLSVTNDGQVRQAAKRSAWEEFDVPVLEESNKEQKISIQSSIHGSAVAEDWGKATARPNIIWRVRK